MTVPLPHAPTSASLHPFLRDRFIVGSANDPWVRVYDLDSGQEKEVYKGHHGPVLCASYSPDGEVYASGSEDGESAPPLFIVSPLPLPLILSLFPSCFPPFSLVPQAVSRSLPFAFPLALALATHDTSPSI